MQVTHQNEFVTHAVIGGKQTIDFGISSSAEFFNILSSTLYKDQILAVVREVLCNAWDAHIEAGCTHKPVELTLTSEKFTIKDFGTGIHHDDMGPIYGTYGNSTKKNDGNQTGGFGLGCKAPFAYTDHFEVISSHANVRTIYNLSKSSAQAQGKPGIIPIASFPTDEHGLQVSIRIKNNNDYARFQNLIHRIVKNGDMNMTLNGKTLDKLGFDTSKGNYLLTCDQTLLDIDTHIMVRYGNVIYPVDSVKEIQGAYQDIQEHLNKLGAYPWYSIIFQAPAHSISVTPSRETLSMQEHTINTLNTLFTGFLATLQNEFVVACGHYATTITEQAVTDKRLDLLLSRKRCLPVTGTLTKARNIHDLNTMAQQYLGVNYPNITAFHKQDIRSRLLLLSQAKELDRGQVHSYLRDLDKVQEPYKETNNFQEKNQWLQRRVIAPLIAKLIKTGMDYTKLYVCDIKETRLMDSYRGNSQILPLVQASKAAPAHHIATLPYLRNIVVLASAKSGMLERAFRHEVFKKLGATYGFLFYHVGLKVADKKAALEFFNSTGMTVVDLTSRQSWGPVVEKATPVPRKPKKKDYVALSSLIYDAKRVYTKNFYKEDAARIENPEFVVRLSFKQYDSTNLFEDLDQKGSLYVAQLFGDKGAVVSTKGAVDTCIDKGIQDFRKYLIEKVGIYMQTSPGIQEYWAFRPSRVAEKVNNNSSLVGLLYNNPVLMKEYSLVSNLTEEDNMYLHLWNHLVQRRHHFSFSNELQTTQAHLEAIPLDPINMGLIDKLEGNQLLSVFNINEVNDLIRDVNTPPATLKKAFALLISVING